MPETEDAASGAASGVKGTLTKKLGPLPLWGWALAVGAAAFVYKKRKGSATATQQQTPKSVAGPGSAASYGYQGGQGSLDDQLAGLGNALNNVQEAFGIGPYAGISPIGTAGSPTTQPTATAPISGPSPTGKLTQDIINAYEYYLGHAPTQQDIQGYYSQLSKGISEQQMFGYISSTPEAQAYALKTYQSPYMPKPTSPTRPTPTPTPGPIVRTPA